MPKRIPSLTLVVLAAPALVLALTAATADADTIYVCWDGSGDYLTIQEGIDAASHGDEVVVCDGVYAGAGNKNLDFYGKAITIRSANGPDNCIIYCQGNARGFDFHSNEAATSVVDGFMIMDGNAGDGAGIRCTGASPTIANCTVTGNMADRGGGISCSSGANPTMTDCTISGNTAGDGGGIHCTGASPTIANCTITGNTADDGAGVSCSFGGNPTITNSTIRGNMADSGGGVHCSFGSSPTIANCTVTANTASTSGGGVHCFWGGNPRITNCMISSNAGNQGGAVYCQSSDPTIGNSTITGNTADAGGAVFCLGDSPTITNCILWGDTPYEVYVLSGSPVITYCDVQGGLLGEGNIDADPLFVDPDGPDDDPNTWEDNDYHLSAGSPCIDAGCNWGVPADTGDLDDDDDRSEITPFDLDGEARFFDDPNMDDTGCGCPPVVDMGAYEFGGTAPQPCPGDLDCDRVVAHSDLGIVLSAWEWSDKGDLDCDGDTDQADLGVLLAHWGEGCP